MCRLIAGKNHELTDVILRKLEVEEGYVFQSMINGD